MERKTGLLETIKCWEENNEVFGKTNKGKELLDSLTKEDVFISYLKSLGEEKETLDFKQLTKQGEPNDNLYILDKGSVFVLIKNGKKAEIKINEETIMGESTFLKYIDGDSKFPANATVEVKGKYIIVPFKKLKKQLNKDENLKQEILSYFKNLEEKRKGKTKPIVR